MSGIERFACITVAVEDQEEALSTTTAARRTRSSGHGAWNSPRPRSRNPSGFRPCSRTSTGTVTPSSNRGEPCSGCRPWAKALAMRGLANFLR